MVKLTPKQELRLAKDEVALALYQARNWLHGTYSKQYPNHNKVKEATDCLKDALKAFDWLEDAVKLQKLTEVEQK